MSSHQIISDVLSGIIREVERERLIDRRIAPHVRFDAAVEYEGCTRMYRFFFAYRPNRTSRIASAGLEYHVEVPIEIFEEALSATISAVRNITESARYHIEREWLRTIPPPPPSPRISESDLSLLVSGMDNAIEALVRVGDFPAEIMVDRSVWEEALLSGSTNEQPEVVPKRKPKQTKRTLRLEGKKEVTVPSHLRVRRIRIKLN